MRSIWLGVLAAFFFAFTFVLNRSMELDLECFITLSVYGSYAVRHCNGPT